MEVAETFSWEQQTQFPDETLRLLPGGIFLISKAGDGPGGCVESLPSCGAKWKARGRATRDL